MIGQVRVYILLRNKITNVAKYENIKYHRRQYNKIRYY